VAKDFFVDFEVRDYELDQYGVVNNAVYLNYLEHTRHAFLNSIGLDPAQVAAGGRSLALSGLNLRFRGSLRSRDPFRVCLAVAELKGARAVFHQRILRLPDERLMLEAWAEAVFIGDGGRPMRIPQDVRAKLLPLLSGRDGS
jgi:YbgC/YbaW family acyl-CoA thioester hydrolase